MDTRCARRSSWISFTLALVVACGTSNPAASAPSDGLQPFEAAYVWIWHGAPVAVSTLKFAQRQAGTWSYASSSEPRGLGFLYPLRPRLESLMRIGDQGVQPLHYHATDGSSADKRGADVSFDWDTGRASGIYDGVKVDLALKSGVQDDLSIQIALLFALRHGQAPSNLSMIDKNSIRDYSYRQEGNETIDTKLGRIDTVIYASQHPGSPRITRFWCAPTLGYVPMRVQQKRIDAVEWTMEIESLTVH